MFNLFRRPAHNEVTAHELAAMLQDNSAIVIDVREPDEFASGHIAGAINPASKNRRSYWVSDSGASVPEEWLEAATEQKGSWWLNWVEWLRPKSGDMVAARNKPGNTKYKVIEPAPGRYVKETV